MKKELVLTLMLISFVFQWMKPVAHSRTVACAPADLFCSVSDVECRHKTSCPMMTGESNNKHNAHSGHKDATVKDKTRKHCNISSGCDPNGDWGFSARFKDTTFLISAFYLDRDLKKGGYAQKESIFYKEPSLNLPVKPPAFS